MRNTIYKYFFKEFISTFTLILLSITTIVWIVQAVNFLDYVTEDGHSFGVYFSYSVLNIPKILNKLIPLVFMISLLVTILNFEKNNELLILWTSGLNKISIVNLAILISILITFLQFFLSVMVSNTSLKAGRSILKSSHISLFPSLIKEKKFIDTVENLTVFVEKKNSNGVMTNVFLRDDTAKFDQSRTIIAKKGYIVKKDEENILVLYNGTIQSEKKITKLIF